VQWLVFALLVVGSSVASFVARERRFRRRWQNVELPAITVGRGAYREGPRHRRDDAERAAGAAPRRAELPRLRPRGHHGAGHHGALPRGRAAPRRSPRPPSTGCWGYLAGGYGFGALAAIVLAALALGAGNDLLLRNHRHAFRRTRNIALASLALHGFVWANITFDGHIVASSARDVAASLAHARVIAAAAFGHAALMLALAYAYRAQLSALTPAERRLEL
jgi:hypothetical protein